MATAIKMIDPQQDEFLAGLESKAKRANHFFRTMANRPEVLKTFIPLYAAIVGPGSVERRVRELVYLTCSLTNHCAYCSAAHTARPIVPAAPVLIASVAREAARVATDPGPEAATQRAACTVT